MPTLRPNTNSPILTVTINPALDVCTSTEVVVGEHKLRCSGSRVGPGGGGVNVARVVQRLGGQALALYSAGGVTGDAFRRLIEAEHVPSLAVPISGSTRESFTVDETSTGRQFRFVLEGPELIESEWRAFLDLVDQSVPHHGFVVVSGSIPPGVPDDFYARIVRLAHAHSAEVALDASGAVLAAALAEGVFLVTPSARELGDLLGHVLTTEESRISAAQTLVSTGAAQHVALTLGADGAVLASADGVKRVSAPSVSVQSTVGAGDSFLGAFVLRLAQGNAVPAAFRAAVAAGTATAMAPAAELCRRADMERLERELNAQGD